MIWALTGKGSASTSLPSIRPVWKKSSVSISFRETVFSTWGRTERPSGKKLVPRWGTNFGWSCMSWRQPVARASAPSVAASSARALFDRNDDLPLSIRMTLMVHLHDRRGAVPGEELSRFGERELGIGGLEAEKKLVGSCAIAKVRSVKERMVRSRQAVHRQHSKC